MDLRRGIPIVTACLAASLSLAVATGATASAAPAPRGTVRVFARVPAPGYPANAILGADGLVYAGTFKPLMGGTPDVPSKVFGFAADGSLRRTFTITGQTPGAVHAVQVAGLDAARRIVLLDEDPPRVVLLDPLTGGQRAWATFPQLAGGNPPEPDFAAWGPDGALYVTDFAQFVVWRVPATGGTAQVWLNVPQLNGVIVGPAGIALEPARRSFLLTTGAGGDNLTTGKLYRVPILPGGGPGPLQQLWQSAPLEAPDGFAVARSGDVYVALVGPAGNAIAELSPTGRQLARFPATPLSPQPSPIPFDAPGSVTFDGTEVLVGNQSSITGDTTHMALLALETGETGRPIAVPGPDGPAARRPRRRPRHSVGRRHHRRHHRHAAARRPGRR